MSRLRLSRPAARRAGRSAALRLRLPAARSAAGRPAPRRRAARWTVALAAAVATGLALVAAFPGPDLGPVAFVALVPLLLVAWATGVRQAALLGYLAGLTFFGVHLAWIVTFGVLAWAALCAAQALFVAAFFALVPVTRRLGGWQVLVLPACWATLELVRAHAPLGGFPWGLLALSQHAGGPLLPLARVVGAYGLGAVIVAVNLALASAVRAAAARRAGAAAAWPVLAAGLVLAGLAAPALPPVSGPPLDLAILQDSVPPGHDRPDQAAIDQAVFAHHLQMTEALAAGRRPDLVVWGEGAANDDPFANAAWHAAIGQAARTVGAPLLIGATTDRGEAHYATEALLFTPGGELADRYAKRRLVPFGEYVPGGDVMRRLVPAADRQVPADKLPGHRLAPMVVDGVRFGTLICYESAYPEDPRRLARDGAHFIVVLTNNTSWGYTPGSRQHLATSQLRAVEEGRTVVHAAVSGISAVVGPDGVARQQTGLYQRATIRAAVAPRSGLTVYARDGRLVEAALVGLAVAGLAGSMLAAGLARRRPPTPPPGRPQTPTDAPSGRPHVVTRMVTRGGR